MVRDEAMGLRDLAKSLLHEASPGVPPEDDLCRREALPRRRPPRQLRSERRAELIRVEVEDGVLSEVPRWEEPPVAAAAGDRQLPEVAQSVRLGGNVAQAVRHTR